ncbi:MAG: T9SS type A sorting domain-containing protein, partial [Bacteroidales bacterium]|nr:T9SS type A sorting domain-containing protein [Bacteroidales bacterium]
KKNLSNLIKYVANEDDPDLRDMLVEFLESQNTVEDYKLALRFSLADNNYHKADELLSDLNQLSQTMDVNNKSAIENYLQLQSIAINAEINNEFSDSIINVNADFLFAMANDTLIVESAQAQVLLEIAGLAEYPPVVYPPIVDNTKSIYFNETVPNIETKTTTFIKIYPNPVKENLFVEYFVFDFENSVEKTIYLFSESGEIINSFKITKDFDIITINTRNLAPGVYLLRLNDCVEKFTKM